jgi:hypothetical protein
MQLPTPWMKTTLLVGFLGAGLSNARVSGAEDPASVEDPVGSPTEEPSTVPPAPEASPEPPPSATTSLPSETPGTTTPKDTGAAPPSAKFPPPTRERHPQSDGPSTAPEPRTNPAASGSRRASSSSDYGADREATRPPSDRPPRHTAPPNPVGSEREKDDSNGLLGPFRIGPVVGVGLPNLLSLGGTLKLTRYLGAGINIGLIPTLRISYYGEATLAYEEYDLYARLYPFGGAFFLGAGVGYENVRGTLVNTMDLSPYQSQVPEVSLPGSVQYQSIARVQTMVLTPQIGLFHTFGSGFSLGLDIGAQIPIAPSQIDFTSQVDAQFDPRLPAEVRQQLIHQYTEPTDQKVRSTLETIGRTPIPTISVRIGWLL